MKNGQKKDEEKETQAPIRLKEDPLTPKRNKRGCIDRFAQPVEEIAKTEKVPSRSR